MRFLRNASRDWRLQIRSVSAAGSERTRRKLSYRSFLLSGAPLALEKCHGTRAHPYADCRFPSIAHRNRRRLAEDSWRAIGAGAANDRWMARRSAREGVARAHQPDSSRAIRPLPHHQIPADVRDPAVVLAAAHARDSPRGPGTRVFRLILILSARPDAGHHRGETAGAAGG